MSSSSKIEWTDATWNPLTGCSLVSEGCRNCYAAREAAGRLSHRPEYQGLAVKRGDRPVFTGEVRLLPERLDQPLRWKRSRRVFVNSMSDLFHNSVPDDFIDRVFAVMAMTYRHRFQVLTKRPERMQAYVTGLEENPVGRLGGAAFEALGDEADAWVSNYVSGKGMPKDAPAHFFGEPRWPLPNVWLGTSVENQATADERVPHLLKTPAAVRFLSCEPLLGPVDLSTAWHGESALQAECWGDCAWCGNGHPPLHDCRRNRQAEQEIERGRSGIDWVIVGGESGPNARPMHSDWARTLRDQCVEAGVAFHFKQWGEWLPWDQDGAEVDDDPEATKFATQEWENDRWNDIGHPIWSDWVDGHIDPDQCTGRVGKMVAGRQLDGRTWDQEPAARP